MGAGSRGFKSLCPDHFFFKKLREFRPASKRSTVVNFVDGENLSDPQTPTPPSKTQFTLREVNHSTTIALFPSRSKSPLTSINGFNGLKKRRFDVVLVGRFDRFARSTKHLVLALEEFKNLGIDFVSSCPSVNRGFQNCNVLNRN